MLDSFDPLAVRVFYVNPNIMFRVCPPSSFRLLKRTYAHIPSSFAAAMLLCGFVLYMFVLTYCEALCATGTASLTSRIRLVLSPAHSACACTHANPLTLHILTWQPQLHTVKRYIHAIIHFALCSMHDAYLCTCKSVSAMPRCPHPSKCLLIP